MSVNTFNVTRQSEIFADDSHAFDIENQLLFDCIGLGGSWMNRENIIGFNRGKESGYALLTYFASRALNFRRLPFCEDRIYTSYFSAKYFPKEILKNLDNKTIQAICDELSKLYQHTQLKLSQAGLTSIAIRREIHSDENGYVETFIRLKKSAELLSQDHIEIEMDTLNSFGDEGHYKCSTGLGVTLELNIPIKDILYCSKLIGNRPSESATMESGEWVVINDSPNGVLRIPTSSIHFRDDMWNEYGKREFTRTDAEKFMQTYNPIILRTMFRTEAQRSTQWLQPTLKQRFVKKLLRHICR